MFTVVHGTIDHKMSENSRHNNITVKAQNVIIQNNEVWGKPSTVYINMMLKFRHLHSAIHINIIKAIS